MTITIMNGVVRAMALSLAVAASNIPADASVRLPTEQMSEMPSLAPVLRRIASSVVTITITHHAEPKKNSALEGGKVPQRTRNVPFERQTKETGSGVIVDAQQGLIFTNNHVIDHADEIIVSLSDGRKLLATCIGSDRGTDIAVIKVQAEDLIPLKVGDSDELEVGDFVLAIGNPYRIGQTVSAGIISGLHRTNLGIGEYEDFIQTDAAIYPGNSGGALVNLRGELVGINTAFDGIANSNPGMGFAIPINKVRSVADRLLKYGEVRRGRLGITFHAPTPALIRNLKLLASATSPVIVKVDKGSPAEGAGLRVGDVVSEFARTSVRDTVDLHNRLALLSAGDVADFTVVRRGRPMVIRATIADQGKAIRSKRIQYLSSPKF